MRLSQFLMPVLKENPKDAQIASHQLMLRAGMIRQLASGIYNWLPLGLRVLKKVENIVRDEMAKSGSLEVLMPTMQPAELWVESGRGNYGAETLMVTDRHERKMIYGPTNEEVITDLFRNNVKSYKGLPLNMFHIQWKFRDEIRPRFGVMRGREFLMKDAYSFHINEESAVAEYNNMFKTYLRIFTRLGVRAIPFRADTGMIGGDLSHEFQVIAETGESQIYYDKKFETLDFESNSVDEIKSLYARADEMHIEAECPVAPENLVSGRGIEVGHIFYLGDKYSKAMNAAVQGADGKPTIVKMGCYGIGVSRLLGAIIEASHDASGIIWPEAVAPFKVGLINIKSGDAACDAKCSEIYNQLTAKGVEVLYDDRAEGAGAKFASMDLIGIPYQIAIGPRSLESGKAEFKIRKTGEKKEVSLDEIIELV